MDPVEGIVALGYAESVSAVLVSEVREGAGSDTGRRRNVIISKPVGCCACDRTERSSRGIISELP